MSHIDPLDSSLLLLLQVGWLRINEKTGYMSPVGGSYGKLQPQGRTYRGGSSAEQERGADMQESRTNMTNKPGELGCLACWLA